MLHLPISVGHSCFMLSFPVALTEATRRSNNLPKMTQCVSGWAGIRTQPSFLAFADKHRTIELSGFWCNFSWLLTMTHHDGLLQDYVRGKGNYCFCCWEFIQYTVLYQMPYKNNTINTQQPSDTQHFTQKHNTRQNLFPEDHIRG